MHVILLHSTWIISQTVKPLGESIVNTLYINVLGRDYAQAGYEYWLSNLNNGVETRYELILGFSESVENKGLFSEMTGFY